VVGAGLAVVGFGVGVWDVPTFGFDASAHALSHALALFDSPAVPCACRSVHHW
jgi:hypothetical protein